MDPADIAALDRQGYTVLEALTPGTGQSLETYSKPCTFICIDGKTYWVKDNVQQGLVAELIAGRLAAKLGAGPTSKIIRVTPEALPDGGADGRFIDLVVGSEDIPGTV